MVVFVCHDFLVFATPDLNRNYAFTNGFVQILLQNRAFLFWHGLCVRFHPRRISASFIVSFWAGAADSGDIFERFHEGDRKFGAFNGPFVWDSLGGGDVVVLPIHARGHSGFPAGAESVPGVSALQGHILVRLAHSSGDSDPFVGRH